MTPDPAVNPETCHPPDDAAPDRDDPAELQPESMDDPAGTPPPENDDELVAARRKIIRRMDEVDRCRATPAANQKDRQRRRSAMKHVLWDMEDAMTVYARAARESVKDPKK